MTGYRSSQWREFRRDVIELDGGSCTICGRGEPEAVLQVHHKLYVPGRMPWEYAYAECETLCKGCHAAKHKIIMPRHGWDCMGYEDLGDLVGACDLCGTALRHQFYVYHPDWGTLEVGTDCCDGLTGSQLASSQVESVQRFERRLTTFLKSKRWYLSGGRHCIKQKKLQVSIFKDGADFRIEINGRVGKFTFPTVDDAKAKVFEVIESGEVESYFRRRPGRPRVRFAPDD